MVLVLVVDIVFSCEDCSSERGNLKIKKSWRGVGGEGAAPPPQCTRWWTDIRSAVLVFLLSLTLSVSSLSRPPSFLPFFLPCFLPSLLSSFLPSLRPCFFPSLLPSFLPFFFPCFLPSFLPYARSFLPALCFFLPSVLASSFLLFFLPCFLASFLPRCFNIFLMHGKFLFDPPKICF